MSACAATKSSVRFGGVLKKTAGGNRGRWKLINAAPVSKTTLPGQTAYTAKNMYVV